eukprot:scaffold2004_cov420-Prasinococcus_capsulatus_cf.AAC.19
MLFAPNADMQSGRTWWGSSPMMYSVPRSVPFSYSSGESHIALTNREATRNLQPCAGESLKGTKSASVSWTDKETIAKVGKKNKAAGTQKTTPRSDA